jgi:hypothetical protein
MQPVTTRDLAEHEALVLRVGEDYSAQRFVGMKESLQHAKLRAKAGAALSA